MGYARLSLSGLAVGASGGVQVFMSPKLALDGGLSLGIGKMGNVKVDGQSQDWGTARGSSSSPCLPRNENRLLYIPAPTGGSVTTIHTMRIACLCVALAVGSAGSLRAQVEIGTWVRKAGPGQPAISMDVERCCGAAGRRLTYHLLLGNTEQKLTVESPFNGTEVPVLVNGKPSGETMAIKRLDANHAFTVVKMNGKPFGTSQATLSPNGRTLTVLNDFTGSAGMQQAGKTTETWLKK